HAVIPAAGCRAVPAPRHIFEVLAVQPAQVLVAFQRTRIAHDDSGPTVVGRDQVIRPAQTRERQRCTAHIHNATRCHQIEQSAEYRVAGGRVHTSVVAVPVLDLAEGDVTAYDVCGVSIDCLIGHTDGNACHVLHHAEASQD